jgi:hypothetical protein
MNKRLISVLIFLLIAVSCFSQNYKKVHKKSGYKHYDNHKTQTHIKPKDNSFKKIPEKTTTVTETTTAPVVEKVVVTSTVYQTRLLSKDTLAKLKAVIISADVDGAAGAATQDYIKGMKELATFLKASGIKVTEFYCPNDNWDKIKEACAGANFFVYSGHGVYDGSLPPKWVGGLCLTDKFIASADMQNELKLAANAVVVFNHACFTAGSSSCDNGKDIGIVEVHRRVAMYAHPFMDMGFGCYYSNNFYGGAKNFFDGFLAGNKVNDIYTNNIGSFSKILEYKDYEFKKSAKIGLSQSQFGSYDLAVVGNPSLSIYDLIKATR